MASNNIHRVALEGPPGDYARGRRSTVGWRGGPTLARTGCCVDGLNLRSRQRPAVQGDFIDAASEVGVKPRIARMQPDQQRLSGGQITLLRGWIKGRNNLPVHVKFATRGVCALH